MTLLILKTSKKENETDSKNDEKLYLKIEGDSYVLCNMNKASVFPTSDIAIVKEHLKKIRDEGYPDAELFELTIIEKKLS